ncbi:PAS/PAC sensor hybrid histidine kinase [Nocardioides sp. PD653]|nr:PAS/PAC sensor hybrid histidine kinase [Nocardioides sp. PD653-B2]GAW57342.1 PAS/PAC sensor hybrid histidine kinase [Nocardioides sp. PD653]
MVVDDAAEVRTLVRTRLRLSRKLDVVGEGADGAEAIEAVRRHRPAMLLLDVSMPGMDGLEALPRVLETAPGTCVVMYSGFQEQGLADRARELGAAAFFEKSTALDTLADDLLAVLAGRAEVVAAPAPTPEGSSEDEADRTVLREHLERFGEVFEDAAIGMATVTLAGRIVRANGALADLLERPVDRLVGAAYADFTAGRGDLVTQALGDILDAGTRVVQFEHDVSEAGSARRVLATLAPVLDSRDRPLYLFLQVQDVSGQRGAEEMLRRSEVRFRLLVENVEDYAIFMLSPLGTIESWNAGAQRIKGYTADDIIGRHFRTFYPREVQESGHPERELELALRDGHYEEEGWRVRKDGSRFWANVLISAVHDQDGRHLGFAKITRDITARREQEEALQQSEERFRLLVETVGDYAIFMLDPDGRITSWNAGAQRCKGYTADEIIGQHFRVFYPPEVQAARHPEHEIEIALSEGRYEEEGWRVRKDGSRFWANVVITAVHDARGRHVGFAKVTRDTSERRAMLEERERAATALAEANAQLAQAAEDQAHFLAVTAHELRTPVGVLGGTADTLVAHWADLEDDERRELLEGMSASAVRLRRLLADLLTASRLQASALELELGPVDVATLVATAVATARRTRPDAEIVIDAEPGLVVVGDVDRLAQAVDNLIANALRHGVSPIRVSARAVGSVVEIGVEDSGPGVPDEMRARLFDRFATGRGPGGTGLGLYIVRQLARSHEGDATYRSPSADGHDGAFVISLPLAATDPAV